MRWDDAGRLEGAWVRIPDGSWLGIEPRATADAPWGWSDRLWHAAEPAGEGWHGTPLTVFEALEHCQRSPVPTFARGLGRVPQAIGPAPRRVRCRPGLDSEP